MYNYIKIITKFNYLFTCMKLYDLERLKDTELRKSLIKKIIQHLDELLNVYRKELHRYD